MKNSRRIALWVEDDLETQREMQRTFNKIYDITFARTVLDAQEQFRNNSYGFGFIVVDLFLDGQRKEDGLNLIGQIKRERPNIPVLAVTGQGRHDDLLLAHKAGADYSFVKIDFDAEVWAEKIDELTAKKQKLEVYLSHAHGDQLIADSIRQYLELYGLTVLQGRKDIAPGKALSDELKHMIAEVSGVIILWSQNSEKSNWQTDELDTIKNYLKSNSGAFPCVPLIEGRLEGQNIPAWLKKIKYLEFKSKQELKARSSQVVLSILGKREFEERREKLTNNRLTNLYRLASDKKLDAMERKDAWSTILKIQTERGQANEAAEAVRKIEKLNHQIRFAANLRQEPYLKDLEIVRFLFFERVQWKFHPRINILLGPNGSGKTMILRLIAALLLDESETISKTFDRGVKPSDRAKIKLGYHDGSSSLICQYGVEGLISEFGKVPFLAIGDLRFLPNDKSTFSLFDGDDLYDDLRTDPARLFIAQKPETSRFIDSVQLLANIYFKRQSEEGDSQDIFEKEPIFKIIQDVLYQLSGNSFRFHKIELVGGSMVNIEVLTPNSPSSIPIQFLSRGVSSVIYLFLVIYIHLDALQRKRQELGVEIDPFKVNKEASIILIDEIDAHMHPDWQRKIPKLLIDSFPNVQFFMTSHSPLVVASCGKGQVGRLIKKNSGMSLFTYDQDLPIGRPIDELYLSYFETKPESQAFTDFRLSFSTADLPRLQEEREGLLNRYDEEAQEEKEEELLTKLRSVEVKIHLIKQKQKLDEKEKLNFTIDLLKAELEIKKMEIDSLHSKLNTDG